MKPAIDIDEARLARLCRRWQVTELAIFGSMVRADFRPDSDIDVLVTFAPDARIGFIGMGQLADELAELLGRPVDLVPKSGLKPTIREEVLATAQIVYAA